MGDMLPDEAWWRILTFLSLDDCLFAVQLVHRRLRRITRDFLLRSTEIHCSFVACHIKKKQNKPIATFLFSAYWLERIFTGPKGSFAKLTHLDFGGLSFFTGLKRRSKRSLFIDIFRLAPNLTILDCTGCVCLEDRALVDAARGTHYRARPPKLNLRHLDLSGCRRIQFSTVNMLVSCALNLESLHLCGISRSTDVAQLNIPCWRQRLRSFQASELKNDFVHGLCTDKMDSLVANHCNDFAVWCSLLAQPMLHQIEEIEVNDLDMLKSSHARIFADDDISRDSFTNLQLLHLNGLRSGLRPGTLCFIAMQSLQLEEAHLSGANLKDQEVQVLALSCGRTLKLVNLECCSDLSDQALQWVGRYCHELVDLNVSACFCLTDHGIVSVTVGCPKLRALRLLHLKFVTDRSLEAIGHHLQHLLLLNVQGCDRLRNCPVLPEYLLEIDKRDTGITSLPDLPALVIKNGRRVKNSKHYSYESSSLCSASWQSQSFGKPMPMWCCRDCKLVPSRGDRGMCRSCAFHCHRDHDIYLCGVRTFYCDCAFGFGACDCQMLPCNIEKVL